MVQDCRKPQWPQSRAWVETSLPQNAHHTTLPITTWGENMISLWSTLWANRFKPQKWKLLTLLHHLANYHLVPGRVKGWFLCTLWTRKNHISLLKEIQLIWAKKYGWRQACHKMPHHTTLPITTRWAVGKIYVSLGQLPRGGRWGEDMISLPSTLS